MAVWHVQKVPSKEWVIVHNLSRLPFVQVMSDDNEVLMTGVIKLNASTATVVFNEPRTGKVLLM